MSVLRTAITAMRSRPWTAILLAVFFIPVYAWFSLNSTPIYASPDERTVAVFAQHWAQQGTFRLHTVIDPLFIPRSVSIVDNAYVPSGFLGLFLLVGMMWRVGGAFAALLFVPVLAAFAPLAMQRVWKHYFSERVAWAATVLMWVFPAWVYYAARGFLPNVAFISGLAFAAAALVSSNKHRAWAGVGGLCLGLALMMRPVEVFWVVPLFLGLAWPWKPVWRQILLATLCAGIPLLVLAYWQAHTYGIWYAAGYVAPALVSEGGSPVTISLGRQLLAGWFPFGIHPVQALLRIMEYVMHVYWWVAPLVCIGLIACIKSPENTYAYKKYAGLTVGLFLYLVVYYGSWPISDHPDTTWVTLGVAYNRYWLPAFILAMPFLVLGLDTVLARVRATLLKQIVWGALMLISVGQAFAFGSDSLWALRNHSVEYRAVAAWVLEQTQPNTVVIAQREEKMLWPQRTVWYQIDQSYDFVPVAASKMDAFTFVWLTDLPPSHVDDLQQRVFLPAGVHMRLESTYQSYQLYVLEPSPRE